MRRAVIIGSGFGGAVTALRLSEVASERGLEVVLLERGRRYAPEDFPRVKLPEAWTPDPDLQTSKRLPDLTRVAWKTDQGLWELRNLDRLQVAQAAGYGGGSLVYASVHLRPPPDVFHDWPEHPRALQLEREECPPDSCTWLQLLAPYYEKVEQEIGLNRAPSAWAKTRAFDKTIGELGRKAFTPPLAITFEGSAAAKDGSRPACTGCGNCTIGCAVGAKNTLDKNYLAKAERNGIEVHTLAEVTRIEKNGTRYVVHYLDHFRGGAPVAIDADYVFLCAGALNSTELLLRSRDALEKDARQGTVSGLTRLGARFWANGDSLAVLFNTDHWDAASGPTITRAVYHREPARHSEQAPSPHQAIPWLLIQDGGIPRTLRRPVGIFRSPLWLGRNGYAAPSSRRAKQVRRSPRIVPREELDAFVAQIPNLFQARPRFRARPHDSTRKRDDFWTRLFPGPLKALFGGIFDVDETAYKEVSYLNETILAQIGTAFQGGTLMRVVTPLVRDLVNLDALTKVTLSALKARLGSFGGLLDAKSVAQLLLELTMSLLLGDDPGSDLGILLGMGPDDPWALELRGERLRVKKKRRAERSKMFARYDLQERLMRDIAAKAGAQLYTNPRWTVGQRPVTVHSQGGCCMGKRPLLASPPSERAACGAEQALADPERVARDEPGVTQPTGEVWGFPNLYVFDGGIIPSSVGVNPSHTIAALAELNVETFIRDKLGIEPKTRPVKPGRDLPSDEDAAVPIRKAPISIGWNERMDGFIAEAASLGDAKPSAENQNAGFLQGLRRGCGLVLTLEVKVPSLNDALIQDRPVAKVTGSCSLKLEPQNESPEQYDVNGWFTIHFDDENATGGMDYDLELLKEGELKYSLQGRKYLKDDPGFDSWNDMTTLFLALYKGKIFSHAGKLGADEGTFRDNPAWLGVLHMHLDDFLLGQVPSFSATAGGEASDDLSNAQQGWALFRFAEFFFRKVRHVYDPGVA